jgi:acetyl coenzyme A synthetase (ADP forming)-like protein
LATIDIETEAPGYPHEFDVDVALRDGTVVRIRPIRPEDAELEARFIKRVSPESSYFRFFTVKPELTEEELSYFTHVDYDQRMAFVAIHDDEMVAVGRYDLIEREGAPDAVGESATVADESEDVAGDGVAEVAFLVEDAYQGRGIGTHLLRLLSAHARLHEVTRFRAFVLAENERMLRVFRDSGYEVRRELSGGLFELEIPTQYTEAARKAAADHEKWAISTSLSGLFRPESVAVIGASRDPASIGGQLFGNLLGTGFAGPVYPVNPSARVVRSVRAYPSIGDVPEQVDLAFIVTPAAHVIGVVEECAKAGVKAVVVISAGFAETGEEGRALERELVETVRAAGMRMVGPNCMGLVNTDPEVCLNGQFGPVFPVAGNVAMSSQSGALGLAIIQQAADIGIGISSFVSVGNKADVGGNDLLLFWEDDPATDVILLYLESFGNPRRFGRLARRVGRKKPIIAVKSGRSPAGARAAASHTGSMANVEVAVEALFQDAGVIRAESLPDMFDLATLMAHQPVPAGRRVAVLTNAGGLGILCADALSAHDLELPELSEELQAELRQWLPAAASTTNPVDMIASAKPEQYSSCLGALTDSDEVDAVIVIYISTVIGSGEYVAAAVRDVAETKGEDKPLLGVIMQAGGLPRGQGSTRGGIPLYPYPEPAARALAAAVKYGEWCDRPEGEHVTFEDVDSSRAHAAVDAALDALEPEGGWLEPDAVNEVLEAFGLTTVKGGTARSPDEAAAIAEKLGGAVVLKVLAPSVVHKSDVDGVALDVRGAREVRQAYRAVTAVAPDAEGALIQQYVEGGHEVIIGMTEDPVFGPLIVFGIGGIYVELMRDVAFRIHPVSDRDAATMIGEVRGARLLEGYRGSPRGDVEAVEEAILRVSALVEHLPEIVEMDLNPVIVREPGDGICVVDARIRVRQVPATWLPSRKDIPGVMR